MQALGFARHFRDKNVILRVDEIKFVDDYAHILFSKRLKINPKLLVTHDDYLTVRRFDGFLSNWHVNACPELGTIDPNLAMPNYSDEVLLERAERFHATRVKQKRLDPVVRNYFMIPDFRFDSVYYRSLLRDKLLASRTRMAIKIVYFWTIDQRKFERVSMDMLSGEVISWHEVN